MFTINDYFNIPDLNEHRKKYLAEGQEHFWFITKKDIIHTELGNAVQNENGIYVVEDVKNQDPYNCVSKEDLENKIVNNWGITNNNEKNYYDLKVSNEGAFYTSLNGQMTEYIIELQYVNNTLKTFELNTNSSRFKINNFSLYKNGHATIRAYNAPTQMSLDGFIVGYTSRLAINEEEYIDINANATILNIKDYKHPNFDITITPNNNLFVNVLIKSEIPYIQRSPSGTGIQEVQKNSSLNYKFTPEI